MSRSSNFLLAGFSKKKSNSVARKKTKDSSKSSLVTPLGSGGDTANPGDANVSGHLCGQGKPMRMVEGAMLSPSGRFPETQRYQLWVERTLVLHRHQLFRQVFCLVGAQIHRRIFGLLPWIRT